MKVENIEILKSGVGVIPTDTVYGLVGSVYSAEAINRICEIKGRSDHKGFVVVISSIGDLNIFGIKLTENIKTFLNKVWPGKVSVELYSDLPEFSYLRRPDNTNAFRLPDNKELIDLLKQIGPLATTSANLHNTPTAKNISEAQKYFGDKVDFYEDGGELDSPPSTLVRIVGDKVEVLRQGVVKI